jgi:hypothetical protein
MASIFLASHLSPVWQVVAWSGGIAAVVVVVGGIASIIGNNSVRRGEEDARIAASLSDGVRTFLSQRAATMVPSWEEVRGYEELRLGEVSRHFDTNTTATINGWLTHELGFHGWAVGAARGGLGLGVGSLGLSGASSANLTFSGTTRDDLMGDGFIAVFERDVPGGVDTVRVVVPSEQATQEWVGALLEETLAKFTTVNSDGQRNVRFNQSYATLKRFIPDLLRFENEASYVSDRLHSVLRILPPESRPPINVYGYPLSEHAVVGAGIQFGHDDRIHPLFPGALVKALPQIVERALTAPTPGAPA